MLAIVTEGDTEARKIADDVIEIPAAPDLLAPILEIVPLQLLAYHIAVRLDAMWISRVTWRKA